MGYPNVEQMPVADQAKATPEELVLGNLKLAVFFGNQFGYNTPDIKDDLIQEAAIGLCMAAKRFDPTKGASFGTYASFWIKQRIKRYLQDNNSVIRVPNYQFDKDKDKKTRKFTQFALSAIYGVFSISVIDNEEDNEFDIKDEEMIDAASNTATTEYNLLVSRLMKETLDEREQCILTERFNLNHTYDIVPTLDELGARFNLTKERIRQIEFKALRKLRKQLELQSNQ